MKYGRISVGHPWHMLPNGRQPLCYSAMTITETTDVPRPGDDVCKNCDEGLRMNGKEQRKTIQSRPTPKTEYRPRFRFDDFDRGRA